MSKTIRIVSKYDKIMMLAAEAAKKKTEQELGTAKPEPKKEKK